MVAFEQIVRVRVTKPVGCGEFTVWVVENNWRKWPRAFCSDVVSDSLHTPAVVAVEKMIAILNNGFVTC